jgi:hypothetical protein
MISRNYIFKIIGIFAFFMLVRWISIKQHNDLKIKGVISNATIIGDSFMKGSNIKYYFNNEKYLTPTGLGSSKIQKLVGKQFPIIYLKEDESVNYLLILKSDFDKFNLPYPDSLKWVCDSLKIDKCK